MTLAAQGAFVVTFGRAGEDKKFQKLGDVEATLQGFAGADYDLQVQHTLYIVLLATSFVCTAWHTIHIYCIQNHACVQHTHLLHATSYLHTTCNLQCKSGDHSQTPCMRAWIVKADS